MNSLTLRCRERSLATVASTLALVFGGVAVADAQPPTGSGTIGSPTSKPRVKVPLPGTEKGCDPWTDSTGCKTFSQKCEQDGGVVEGDLMGFRCVYPPVSPTEPIQPRG